LGRRNQHLVVIDDIRPGFQAALDRIIRHDNAPEPVFTYHLEFCKLEIGPTLGRKNLVSRFFGGIPK